MKLALVGVSHRQAPVELRERVAVDAAGATTLAGELALGCEAVVLSTCNRTELYLASEDDGDRLDERASATLLALAGTDGAALAPVLYRLGDDSAALHLFRVAAGLDSLVPGEGEILGQVRDAFEGGAPGPLLDRLFRQALHAGRRARSETAIGESPASVPAAAAALAQQVFGDLASRSVLLVGAGKMSELTARNLLTRGARITAVANRTIAHGAELAARVESRAVGLDEIPGLLATADVVVTSTSAPGFVIEPATAAAALRGRRGKPLLFVDLAVPRDVDPALATIDGCFVYDVDDLEAVVEASLAGRRVEAVRAEQIVAVEAERFREWQASLTVVPAIASLHARAEEIRTGELAKAEGRLGKLPESERKLVESMTSQIVAKILHLPTVRMKEAAAGADGVVYADVVRHLFGLGEEEQRDATGDRREAAAFAGTDCLRPHPPPRPPPRAESRAPRLAAVLLRVGSRGSRLALTQAELAMRCAARGRVAARRGRPRPDHDGGRSRSDEPVRRDRCPRRLRQGARGGAARGPDRRRGALGQGHDILGRRGPRRRCLLRSGRMPAMRSAAQTPSARECGSVRPRPAERPSFSPSSRRSRSSRCGETSTRACASVASAASTRSCSPHVV